VPRKSQTRDDPAEEEQKVSPADPGTASPLKARIAASAASNTPARLPSDHFVMQLGFGLEIADGAVLVEAMLRPAMWGTGSRRVRMSILATLVDVAGGHVPDGARTPTLDLRVQTLAAPPEEGTIAVRARAWRVGKRLVVSESSLHDEAGVQFARGTTTFLNNPLPAHHEHVARLPESPIPSFEGLLGTRIVDERSLELNAHARLSNGLVGTVQGGVQAMLAELTAEHAAGDARATVDIDMRYLTTLREGPLRATAHRVGRQGSLDCFRVDLVDVGKDHALVSTATILSEPLGR
jgi:acyl-coenzyme A thioesterase PaaI-like protein